MAKGNFKKVGDWNRATRLCNNIGGDIDKVTKTVLRQIGLKTERLVVKYIKSQPGSWKPLDETYKERKIKQGYSPMMLIRTSDYFQKINSHFDEVNKQVFVGVKKGVKNKEGDDLVEIGAVLEYGRKSDKDGGRPHFRPIHKRMNRVIRRNDIFNKSVLDYIHKKYSIR